MTTDAVRRDLLIQELVAALEPFDGAGAGLIRLQSQLEVCVFCHVWLDMVEQSTTAYPHADDCPIKRARAALSLVKKEE